MVSIIMLSVIKFSAVMLSVVEQHKDHESLTRPDCAELHLKMAMINTNTMFVER
jgi:hypothetical protein